MQIDIIMEVKPGFFGLPLKLFQVEAYDHLHARINSCHRKLHTPALTMNVAILNLLGMLYYSVRQVGNALTAFQHALSIDPDSINSLQNISLVYERLSRNKDASDARHRVQVLLQPSVSIARARCLAEQGFALTFGLLDGKDNLERFELSTQYLKAAIQLSEHTTLARGELACWYLCMGKIMHKIVDAKNRKRLPREDVYLDCLETFLKAQKIVANLEEEDKSLHAIAWQFLGTLNTKKGGLDNNNIYDKFNEYDMVTYFNNPDECFENAIWLDPCNSKHYTRYARSITRRRNDKESYQSAIDLLSGFLHEKSSRDPTAHRSKSVMKAVFQTLYSPITYTLSRLVQITRPALQTMTRLFTTLTRAHDADASLPRPMTTSAGRDETFTERAFAAGYANISGASMKTPTVLSPRTLHTFSVHLSYRWFPLMTRGRLHLQMYRKKFGNIENLHSAFDDFTEAVKIQRPVETLADFGEVCHCLGMHYKAVNDQQSEEYTKYMNLALTYFMEAMLCLDGDGLSFNHSRYAACLEDYGEVRPAVESYKRAIENEGNVVYIPKAFQLIGMCLLRLYDSGQAKDVLAELAYWLAYAQAKCGSRKLQPTFQHMYDAHMDGMKDLLHHLAQQKKLKLLRECLGCLTKYEGDLKDLHALCADVDSETDETSLQAPVGEHTRENDPTMASQLHQISESLTPEASMGMSSAGVSPGARGLLTHVPESQQSAEVLAQDAAPSTNVTTMTHSELMKYIPFPLERCKNQRNKKYDFFVLFHANDAQWVYYNLLPKCEKNFHFKGCIEDRDYKLGESTFENFQHALEESVCTIVVITEHLAQDRSTMNGLDRVLDKTFRSEHNIIPIKLSACELPHQLHTTTCLDAVSHMDWDRLQRNLLSQCSI